LAKSPFWQIGNGIYIYTVANLPKKDMIFALADCQKKSDQKMGKGEKCFNTIFDARTFFKNEKLKHKISGKKME
jgi:hypothetical protein